jgi:heat shock protein HslJ
MKHSWIFIALLFLGACHATKNAVLKEKEKQSWVLYLASYKVDCKEGGPETCFLMKTHPDSAWTSLNEPIEGFEFTPGYTYTLEVAEKIGDPTMVDASSKHYQLLNVISKTPDKSLKNGLHDIWGLIEINATPLDVSLLPKTAYIELNTQEKTIQGSTSCNNFRSTFTWNPEKSSIRFVFPVGQTKMACLPHGIEPEFLEALERTNRYKRNGINLLFFDGDQEVMEFRKMD